MFGDRFTLASGQIPTMAADSTSTSEEIPWPQQLLDSVWLLALAAIIYWVLAYIVWGIIDILTVPMG